MCEPDATVTQAAAVLVRRWGLSPAAAAAAVFDIADETGVGVRDLAALMVDAAAAADSRRDVYDGTREVQLVAVQAALSGRQVAEQATGIVMALYGVDSGRAAQLLARWSQTRNVEVSDLAAQLVDRASTRPDDQKGWLDRDAPATGPLPRLRGRLPKPGPLGHALPLVDG